jgi:hypothetical protein
MRAQYEAVLGVIHDPQSRQSIVAMELPFVDSVMRRMMVMMTDDPRTAYFWRTKEALMSPCVRALCSRRLVVSNPTSQAPGSVPRPHSN